MESLNCNSPDKEMQDDVFKSSKEEQCSVRARKRNSRHIYSREELVQISKVPLSKKRPEHLSVDFQNDDGLWDPEMWHRSADREKKPSLVENDPDIHHPYHRFVDPKERLKEELRDGIVLSPQRKSFVTGCHVTTGGAYQAPSRGRDASESDSRDRDNVDMDKDRRESREMIPQRRIGSGRLTIDHERYDERCDDSRFDNRHSGHDNRQDDWRQNNRSVENRHRREEWSDYGHNRHDRMRSRRSNHHMSESEPEWFTAGPSSQSDTIELRGFNDRHEEDPKPSKLSKVEEKGSSSSIPVVHEPPPSTPKRDIALSVSETSAKIAPSPGADFDINELFNMDISGIRGGPSPVEGEPVACGSRFSQWFSHPSETASGHPSSHVNTDYDPIECLLAKQPRRSASVLDESNKSDVILSIANLQSDSPLMSNTQAMISAMRGQGKSSLNDPAQSPRRMEADLKAMLLTNNNAIPTDNRPSMGVLPNRFKTVSELEAGLPQSNPDRTPVISQQRLREQSQTTDMSAFNKLVGMMKMSGSLPDSKRESPTMDLLVAKYEQHQKQQLQQQLQSKLLQHQENMARQNPTIITKPASPVPPMTGVPPNMTQSTPRMVSPNPVLQQQHLLGQASTPRAPSPIMFGQQPPLHLNAPSPVHAGSHGGSNQNLSVNSLQVNSGCHSPVLARVPSPQELVYHTQAIMQNALIKKQLEDQKERFIKKQQRDRSPCDMSMANQLVMPQAGIPLSMTMSPSPCIPPSVQSGSTAPQVIAPNKPTTAFTPTSVIKKMAVERSNSKDKLRTESINSDIPDDSAAISDPSRVVTAPSMPQQVDMRIRRALVGSGSMKGLQQQSGVQQIPNSQQQSITSRSISSTHMYQSPGGLTAMPTAIPRLNAPILDKVVSKSSMIGQQGPNVAYNMPMNLLGHLPRHNIPGNQMLHLQALQQQQSNTARVPQMNHPGLGQMNHLQHALPSPVDPPQLRGYYPPMPGQRMPHYGVGVHRSISPQPLMTAVGNRSPNPCDNDLSKWFGMDMLQQQLPSMPPLPAQGQRVLTVDELERRQQVVS